MNKERIRHALTFYHYRRRSGLKLMMCTCGWTTKRVRSLRRRQELRSIVCRLRGHRWSEEPEEAHFGPAGFEESEETLISKTVQCDFCWKLKEVG